MSEKHLHIISFDIPYPPVYGGVIDIFYKIKYLYEQGVKVHLHCFEYNKGEKGKLEQYCETVNYYKRKTSFSKHLSFMPYVVNSRISEELVQNILKDNYPILFEGLHTCGILNDEKLKNRFKIFRESNIEHRYYFNLGKSEKNILKKLYFFVEALKLKSFERIIKNANLFLVVSQNDEKYFKEKYKSNKVVYLPSFHENNNFDCLTGKGEYILYHGNLSVPENTRAAEFIIDSLKEQKLKLIVAGLNPPEFLKKKVIGSSNIKLIESPSDAEMTELIRNAHVNLLVTFQGTGLKLKLLNTLFKGRFCLVNSKMLEGTDLETLCIVKNSKEEFISTLKELVNKEFGNEEIEKRKIVLNKNFSNKINSNKLIECL